MASGSASGLRKVSAELLTTLGWLSGTLHVPTHVPLEEHVALGRHHLKLTGVAPTDVQVAQFITKLNTSKLVRDVNLVVSDEYIQEKDKLRKFQIEMTIDPSAEVTAPEPEKNTASVELGEVTETK